jgi:hypothetical protein
MSIVPATYFSTAIRRAQQVLGGSADSISLAAMAQLRTAYEVLAADAEALQSGPVFQTSGFDQQPFGYAPAIDLSRLPSLHDQAHGHFARPLSATPPQDAQAVILGFGQ